MTPILPGATIGFLGGGQLGRMTAMAARSMGYDVHVLDPDPNCSARAVASKTITAPFNDVSAAVELARGCDVVTLEIEQISKEALDAAAQHVPVRPGSAPVYIIQDRIRQKRWLRDNQFPVGDFREANEAGDIEQAVLEMGACVAKSTHGGYDGRGQVRIADPSDGVMAWNTLGKRACLVEQMLPLLFEISVLVARRPNGETVVYDASYNVHTRGVLTWAVTPAMVNDRLLNQAAALAPAIAKKIGIVGLLAVEFFVTGDGHLLVNELAPRPHNTYHHSERAATTSQFEQLVRAICDLPLGSVDIVTPAAIINLLGEVWLQKTPPNFADSLNTLGSRLHLYGKAEAREGRKMGHISATASSSLQAVRGVLTSYNVLTSGSLQVGPHDSAIPDLGGWIWPNQVDANNN
ncbi:MAG: 5-(carboxyamino)imidazole ribonucleotide synthase [Gemmatimonadaceae bacterium]